MTPPDPREQSRDSELVYSDRERFNAIGLLEPDPSGGWVGSAKIPEGAAFEVFGHTAAEARRELVGEWDRRMDIVRANYEPSPVSSKERKG